MSMWTAIVIIVAVVALSRAIRDGRFPPAGARLSNRAGEDRDQPRGDDPTVQRELEDLRERIRVLERIATEGNSLDARETRRLSDEIEALRQKQDS